MAEATIFFGQEQQHQFQHIVYPGVLNLEAAVRFLGAFASAICRTHEAVEALPLLIRTIWLCASLL